VKDDEDVPRTPDPAGGENPETGDAGGPSTGPGEAAARDPDADQPGSTPVGDEDPTADPDAPIQASAGDGEGDADPLSGLWDGERAAGEPSRALSGPPPRGRRRAAGASSGGAAGERPPRDPVRATVRGLGQLLITAGVVVLLFVVYEIWVTNLFGEQKQAAASEALDKLWAQESDVVTAPGQDLVTQSGGTVVVTAPADKTTSPTRARHYNTTEGVGFAKMYVPSFGADFVLTIIEGTSQPDLYAGPGHYQGTQYPGEPGNFALAGHRVNKGAPFDDLGLLNSCDAIVVETVDDWYVYRVLPMQDEGADWATSQHAHCAGVDVQTGQYAGVYGREITVPTDYPQILPVPHVDSTVVPDDAESLITLTTCHPKFSDRERMIIHGILVKTYPKKAGFLPPQLQETS
jgi:sortase (surface protein transpeptidase)